MVLEALYRSGVVRVGVFSWRLGIRVNGLGHELSVPCEEKEKEPKEEQKEQKLEQKEKEEEKDDEDYDDNSFDDNMSVPESIQEESDLGSDTRRTEDSV